jgi:Uma2 family endonuclease
MGRIITEMEKLQELIEAPLSREELAVRYRDLCEDPLLANVPGKIELDSWGRMVISPPGVYHGLIQGRLCQLLPAFGGEPIVKAPIATPLGLFVPDVAWASTPFMELHRREDPLMDAPEICIEVVSPSNSVKELQEKKEAYLSAGAHEVWIVYLQSRRCEFHGAQGRLERSSLAVDLSSLFA